MNAWGRRATLLAALGIAAPVASGRAEEEPALPPGCAGAFRVDNRSSRTIRSIYFSGTALNDGDFLDRLGEAVLPPGLAMTFRYARSPRIDILVVRDDGRRLDLRNLDICRLPFLFVTDTAIEAAAQPSRP